MRAKTLSHPEVVMLLWTTVVLLAVVGIAVFFTCADAGAVFVVIALVLAAPASSATGHVEQRISDVEDSL